MMIRISALNEETDEESGSEEEVTKEALEEIALQQYAKTLELQKKGNLKDALQLLRDLLDTELLDKVQKSELKENVSRPLLNLKYLCYRNVASLSAQLGDKEAAVDAYLEASALDDSDVTLWFRLGKLSLQSEKYDLALYAFQRGVDCNTKHWPCLDNLIIVLLGLGEYNACISNIYFAFEMDQEYLRGRVYRKHIFTEYPYIREYLAVINPIYKWTPDIDIDICGKECDSLLSEAISINEIYTKQILDNQVVSRLPVLPLHKPILQLTWLSVGESLVDMHKHISENMLSHACVVTIRQTEDKEVTESAAEVEPMEVDACEGIAAVEEIEPSADEKIDIEPEKVVSENEDVEKIVSENEKTEVEIDNTQVQDVNKANYEGKDVKKNVGRRRGSSLSFLEQWEWCNKRRSSRKKTSNRPDRVDDTIYDALKRLLPQNLLTDEFKQEKVKDFKGDDSLDTMDLYKLFEEKEKTASNSLPVFSDSNPELNGKYFGTEREEKDVQTFINKYVESQCDIITMLDEFLITLSNLWEATWPSKLGDVYMAANLCAKQHFDPPLGYTDNELLKTFVNINLVHLEAGVSKMTDDPTCTDAVDPELLDLMRVLCSRKKSFGSDVLKITLRYLWVKCHALLLNNQIEFALDCLYYIIHEFNFLEDKGNTYSLHVPNFSKNSIISKNSAIELLKSLERNKHLATVLSLYNAGKYEEVLPILLDSFKYCQMQANKQEWSSMALDWAGHLVTLLETLWALDNVEECFTWAVRCLHEGLKQFLMTSPGNFEYNKWSLTVMKILVSIEHILRQEGSLLLDILPEKVIARFVQDIVQIIVHQLDEANNTQDMPIDTVVPWIILHFIFQREEDCGRMKKPPSDEEPSEKEEIPPSLTILFLGHDYLGKKSWCCNNNGHLLYYTLNTVIPRLRSPALSSVVETVSQCLEQIIFCLFGHPSKKTKLRYLIDHNVIPFKIDWKQSEQIFELFRPEEMPEFNSYRLGSITAETEQLFLRMLSLLPSTCDPQPHISEVISYIESKKDKLPDVNINLPYKMRDIYYLLADFYLKNNETVKALKYYAYDIVISKNRFDSWAGMALARGSLLETKLNSCETFKTEMEYLTRAAAVERCFKKALQIDSSHSMLWIEYGAFVYGVHSFCSRMLKQASESLSMESFEVLENRKENMLDTSHKCFVAAHKEWMSECETEDKGPQDERWLHYYMLGKISEKKNEPPNVYLDHYAKAGKFLQQNNATYPMKINYNNPQNLSVEALEIHYRIHASILKYMEQHENKTISMVDGQAFKDCLTQCSSGPFSLKKKVIKETLSEKDAPAEAASDVTSASEKVTNDPIEQSASGKRVIAEDEANNQDVKKIKLNDTLTPDGPSESGTQLVISPNEAPVSISKTVLFAINDADGGTQNATNVTETINNTETAIIENNPNEISEKSNVEISKPVPNDEEKVVTNNESSNNTSILNESKVTPVVEEVTENVKVVPVKAADTEVRRTSQESATTNTVTSRENSSSSSSSDSSSDDSSSESSSDSSGDSSEEKTEGKSVAREMTQDDIEEVIKICLDSLEDCVSRFPQHYKAIYRLAHYHFYYKKDKNVERCRDLMLSFITGRAGSKLQGLFCERKNSNFFNGIWRIPASEVDRPGSFASHMSRCVLITMEVLKEIDDHKTLLDLCLQLQRTPDAEKKYLRDSERGELSQQAFSLCMRSLKAQLAKFNVRPDFSANQPEKKTLSSLMLDIYRAYQKVQKHVASKSQQFSILLIECYKLSTGNSIISEPSNLLDLSIKHCQSLIVASKQQAQAAIAASTAHITNPTSAPVPTKRAVQPKPAIIPASSFLPNAEPLQTYSKNPYQANMTSPYAPYLPVIDPNLLSALSNFDKAAATLSYVSNIESLAGLAGMTGSSYQTDLLRQYIATSLDTAYLQQMKPVYNQSTNTSKVKSVNVGKNSKTPPQQIPPSRQPTPSTFMKYPVKHKTPPKNPQPFTNFNQSKYVLKKQTHGNVMRSVLNQSNLSSGSTNTVPAPPKLYNMPVDPGPAKTAHSPVSLTPPLTGAVKPAHMVTTSTVNAALHTKPPLPHQQVSPGKTLQEKLAERQKQNPGASKSGSAPSETPAYSGKIPSSLTITKANVSAKSTEETAQASNESYLKPTQVIKKSLQFNPPQQQLARPKNVIDTTEVIVLDDD